MPTNISQLFSVHLTVINNLSLTKLFTSLASISQRFVKYHHRHSIGQIYTHIAKTIVHMSRHHLSQYRCKECQTKQKYTVTDVLLILRNVVDIQSSQNRTRHKQDLLHNQNKEQYHPVTEECSEKCLYQHQALNFAWR